MEAEDLQEDLTCSICLDYFEDPVSIECGHNFCRGCLHRSWAPGGGSFPCPECRQPSPLAALRPNWALARLTERMRLRRQGRVPPSQCDRHREALRLFCEDDQRPVCLVCRESREHQAHTMTPIDEAFYSYREKLLKAQCSLKDKMKKAIYFQDMEVKNATEWKEKMKNQRVRFSAEFAKLHRFLEEEEKLFLQSLSEEEEELKKKQNENTLKLHQKITSLKQLISEVREKSESPTLELLQETTFSSTFKEERHWNRLASYFWQEIASHEVPVTYPNNPKDVLTRSDSQDVNYSPEILTMKTVCQIPMMKEMLKRFQVAVSVVEDTAHPKLVFSQGGRYVKNGASASSWPLFSSAWSYVSGWRNSQNTQFVGRFQHLPCVLGKNIFTSGKHYWEVENRDSLEIAVGVCRGDVMGLADGSEMCPHMGIWALSWGSAGYRPLTSSPVSPTKQEPALQRVGVFLDSDAGDISFYSAVDGTHLHTFSCPLASRLRPFFWLSPLASLVIPAVTARK